MSKFIVVKKNDLFLYLLISILLLVLLYSSISYSFQRYTTLSTSSNAFKENINKYDLDGDGNVDDIEFSTNSKGYLINIKTHTGNFLLESSDYVENFIDICDSFNIKLQFSDLSRDGIPEIIISGMKDNCLTSYIFYWDGLQFSELLSTTSNITGVLNSNNSICPNFLYGISSKGDSSTEGIYFVNDSIKNISFSNPKIPTFNIVQSFIDIIELDYELDTTPDIFSNNISTEELALLWNLDKEQNNYSFQSGYFSDTNWNSQGEIENMHWILSFQKYDSSKSKNSISEIVIFLNIILDEHGNYKIESIKN